MQLIKLRNKFNKQLYNKFFELIKIVFIIDFNKLVNYNRIYYILILKHVKIY